MFGIDRQIRNRHRSRIRGYRRILKSERLQDFRSLIQLLIDCKLVDKGKVVSPFFFGKYSDHELSIRQFVIQKYGGQKLVRDILVGIGDIGNRPTLCTPSQWFSCLKHQQIVFSRKKTNFRWKIESWIRFCFGFYTFWKLFLGNLISVMNKRDVDKVNCYFDALSLTNIPGHASCFKYWDICTWYKDFKERDTGNESVRIGHSAWNGNLSSSSSRCIRYLPPPMLQFTTLSQLASFFMSGLALVAIGLYQNILGRWWYPFLLEEALKAKAVSFLEDQTIADEYLFHFSGCVYRPLWSYEVEAKGAQIVSYFYSTYDQPGLGSKYTSQKFEFCPNSWPKFLVWDEVQGRAIRKYVGNDVDVSVVGPIGFSDSQLSLPDASSPIIAVFNVDPHRRSSHYGISTTAEYHHHCPDARVDFLMDIAEIGECIGAQVLLKLKRDIGPVLPKSYKRLLKSLKSSRSMTVVEPSISAHRLILKADVVISYPFTSTSLIASYFNKPSAFYDPSGWVRPDDVAARGVPILTSKTQLEQWVRAMLNDTKRPTEPRDERII